MIQKQPVNINFSKGVDTKSDPWQIPIGNFLALENSVFDKYGQLKKRNGFGPLTALPNSSSTYLTTFNGGLTAIGDSLYSYSDSAKLWANKGTLTPLDLSVKSVIRNNLNQTYADAAVSDNGLLCSAYLETDGSTTQAKYAVFDNSTGQTVVLPTLIPASGVATYAPKVFYLKPFFIIVYDDVVTATDHLTFIAISENNPTVLIGPKNLANSYVAASTGTFDGCVVGTKLYLFYNATGTSIEGIYIDQNLIAASSISFASESCTNISVTADTSGSSPIIWASWIEPTSKDIRALAVSLTLNEVLAPTDVTAASDGLNITSDASNGLLDIYYEVENDYPSGAPSHYISHNSITQSGTAGTDTVVVRSVGLASRAFIYDGVQYFLGIYVSDFQPTYFLINEDGKVISRLAYENGPGSYYVMGLPGVSLINDTAYISYLFKDLIEAVNKGTNLPTGSQTGGIYSQTGANLAAFAFGTDSVSSSEIGSNLNITGGFVSMYDGVSAVEQNFFLYPDGVTATWSATGGSIAAKPDGTTNTNAYFYQVTYEWTDNQGNAFRSAPSVPISVTTTGSGTTGSIELFIPTLRLTYKTLNPVKIVIYRWSVAQENYYQVTSITSPLLNDTAVDGITYTDTKSDASILGNNLIYTTGGVLENLAPPASNNTFLFDDRLFAINSEDRNLIEYSKQVIEGTPVEMSDLLTIYVAPTTAAQGSSGDLTCGFPMDDKAILFKKSAIYYFNGTGPDNTGANSQYSQPIFVTSTVGTSNPKSIVFIPQGLMFQSDKGIWLLGRDLSTSYIGAAVEAFNDFRVLSAVNIPSQNQVRFTLENGIVLMYDYFFNQWGTFTNIPAISSALFQGLHTYINSSGQVYQETPGKYLDGSKPTLLSFTTGWINIAGLQGYQRAYFLFLLGQYISPHKLAVSLSYDYNPAVLQTELITPTNFTPVYGGAEANGQFTVYGQDTPYGGGGNVEDWRIILEKGKCTSLQIRLQEYFDPSIGVQAGAGLTLSGLNLIIGIKKGYRPISAAHTAGT